MLSLNLDKLLISIKYLNPKSININYNEQDIQDNDDYKIDQELNDIFYRDEEESEEEKEISENEEYSKEELKELNPNINCKQFSSKK